MDWSSHYPAFIDHDTPVQEGAPRPLTKPVTIADIGCGFGGLLVALSPLLPDELILGMEIRTQVTSYVNDRILALRRQNQPPKLPTTSQPPPQQDNDAPSPTLATPYQNISALRTNSMKFLPNFFPRASLAHLFLCFPDPHFKARKHKARIVSETLCAEYAYVLKPGGCVWCITDVEELAGWMRARFREFGKVGMGTVRLGTAEGTESGDGVRDGGEEGLFAKVEVPEEGREEEWEDKTMGILVKCMREETEEGKKVTRNGGKKFVDVWRRKEDLPWPGES